MLHNSSLSLARSVQIEVDQHGVQPAFAKVMELYAALCAMIADVEQVPHHYSYVADLFIRRRTQREEVRLHFLNCQRVTFFILHDRISCIRLEVKWYMKDEKRECAQLSFLIDERGDPINTSWTYSGDRLVV